MGEQYEPYAKEVFTDGVTHLKEGVPMLIGGLLGKPEYTGHYHDPIAYGAERIRKGLVHVIVTPLVMVEDSLHAGVESLKNIYRRGRQRIAKVLSGPELQVKNLRLQTAQPV